MLLLGTSVNRPFIENLVPKEGYDANRILACRTVQKIEISYSNLRSIFRVVSCGVVNLSGNCPADYAAVSMTSANAAAVSACQPGRTCAYTSNVIFGLEWPIRFDTTATSLVALSATVAWK